jgi:hypothetical protein
MAATLATLRDRVELMLADTGNAIWSTDDIDEGIRQAVHEYSKTRPLRSISTLTLSADGREIDASSLTGLLSVSEIWVDYTSSDPEFPPNRRSYAYWPDEQTIYVTDDYEPTSGDVVRVFYTKLQTLNGLDSETTTSILLDDETLIAVGACGYAATSRAVDLAEQVFRSGLKTVGRRMALEGKGDVELPDLDRWERDGQGWS